MIFATVGTHEDPFDRLVTTLDRLVFEGVLKEEVVIQYGYSRPPVQCKGEKMIAFSEVQRLMSKARVVITHGGPASIMQVMAHGKVPVVVPRRPEFHEHVDGHQVAFAKRLSERVLLVLEMEELGAVLCAYEERVAGLQAPEAPGERARSFSLGLDRVCRGLLKG